MTDTPRSSGLPSGSPATSSAGLIFLAWLVVGLPLAWGVMQTLEKAMALFH
jgi:hypothetical protein